MRHTQSELRSRYLTNICVFLPTNRLVDPMFQVMQRKLRLSVDTRTSHTYICEHHKQIIQSIRTSGKRKRKDDDHANDDDMSINDFHDSNDHHSGGGHSMGFGLSSMKSYSSNSLYDVDLHSLQVNTLRRYKRHYRISTKPGLNKTQLAEVKA